MDSTSDVDISPSTFWDSHMLLRVLVSLFLLIAEQNSIVWLYHHVYSPVDEYWRFLFFQFGTIMNKAATNILLQVFFWTYVLISVG